MNIYGSRPHLTARDFDTWRDKYGSMPYVEQVRFHSMIWRDYPGQHHYNVGSVRAFFDAMESLRHLPRHVLEIGGWTGDVAAIFLPDLVTVEEWLNVELCEEAVGKGSHCTEKAYRGVVLEDFVWRQPREFFERFDVLFASHSFEHLDASDVDELLRAAEPIEWLYVDAPLSEQEHDWKGYLGTHKLELSWPSLVVLIREHGWRLFGGESTSRWFRRVT